MYKRYTLFAFHIWLLKKTSIIGRLFMKTPLPVQGKELVAFLPRAMKSLWKKTSQLINPRFSASRGGFLN